MKLTSRTSNRSRVGVAIGDAVDVQPSGRGRQVRAFGVGGLRLQQFADRSPGAAGLHDVAPRADHLLHRREGPVHEQRRGEDRPRRYLLLDRQICPRTQRQRLQQQPEELGERDVGAGGEVGVRRQLRRSAPLEQVAAHQALPHPERVDHAGCGRGPVEQHEGAAPGGAGALQGRLGRSLVQRRHQHQAAGPYQGQGAEQRVDQEADHDVDRGPRRIEQRQHAAAR